MNIGTMKNYITFQRTENGSEWEDIHSTYAYINGLSGTEFFIANAGGDAALTVTVTCRYNPKLLSILPTDCRIKDEKGIVYELISPADDVRMEHKEIRFRARRIYL